MKKALFVSLIAGIFIVALASIGYFFWMIYQLKNLPPLIL